MKAFVLYADWQPRPGYTPSEHELLSRKASQASRVWRHPRLVMEEVADPAPQPDEVVIKVRACGVCGSDIHCVVPDSQGYVQFSGPARFPVILGHEYSGEIVAAGSRVRTIRVGEPVAAEGMLWCGLCEPCRRGRPNQCVDLEMVGFSAPGAFAEYIATKERYCWSLLPLLGSPGLSASSLFELGALLEPTGCAYNGLFVGHDCFRPGVRVAVFGAGPIGLAAVALAHAGGASQIVAFDPSEERLRLASVMGAHRTYGAPGPKHSGTSLIELLMESTAGHGFDIEVEAAGAAKETVPVMTQTLAPNGRIVYLGRTGAQASVNLDSMVSGASVIAGSRGHAGHGIYPNVIRMVAAGLLPLGNMVTARHCFPHVEAALHDAADRRHGKVMVTSNPSSTLWI